MRVLNGVPSYYIYDGEKPIAEYRGNFNQPPALNVYGKGIDEILMRTDYSVSPNRVLYYQQDHEGSITHLLDSNRNVIESYRYDAFGTPIINGGTRSDSAINNRFMFTGREYVPQFGIYEYRARAYHPGIGRFMSEDPKLFVRRMGMGAEPKDWSFGQHPDEGEFNLFRYCGNDPEDFTDAMGADVFGYDTAGEYFHEVGQTLVGELKGAGSVLSLGFYQPSSTNINQQGGIYVGQALTVVAIAAATKAGAKPGGASENVTGGGRLQPHPDAQGPHTSFKMNPETGKVTKYQTYERQTNPRNPNPWQTVKRVDTQHTKPHTDYNKETGEHVPTPHVHDPNTPGGVRPAGPDELPRNNN